MSGQTPTMQGQTNSQTAIVARVPALPASDPSPNPFGVLGLSLGGALYTALTLMTKFQNAIMQMMNEFKADLAKTMGGLDGQKGLVQHFLDAAIASAEEGGDAIRAQAWGSMTSGIVGGLGVLANGATCGAGWFQERGLNTQLKDAQAFQAKLNSPSTANVVMQTEKPKNITELKQDLAEKKTVLAQKEAAAKSAREVSAPDAEVAEKEKAVEAAKADVEKAEKAVKIHNKIQEWKTGRDGVADFLAKKPDGKADPEQQSINDKAAEHLTRSHEVQKEAAGNGKTDLEIVRKNLEKRIEGLQSDLGQRANKRRMIMDNISAVGQSGGNIGQGAFNTNHAAKQQDSDKDKALQSVISQGNQTWDGFTNEAGQRASSAQQNSDQTAEAFGAVLRGQTRA